MKKILLFTVLLGLTFLNAEEQKLTPEQQYFKNIDYKAKSKDIRVDPRKNKIYKGMMEDANNMGKKFKFYEGKNKHLPRILLILIKLNDLEYDAIEAKDIRLISSYNILRKCLLFSETDEDIKTCQKDYQDNL